MKIEWNKRYTTLAAYSVLVLIAAVILVFLFLRIDAVSGFFTKLLNASKPLIYAVGIAYILWPLLRIFETKVFAGLERKRSRKKLVRTLSLVTTYIIFLAILSLFFGTLIPQISDSIATLVGKVRGGYLTTIENWIEDQIAHNPLFGSEFFREQLEQLNSYISKFTDWLTNNISNIVGSVTVFAANFATEIKNILLGIIFAIYFLLFKEHLIAQVRKFFSAILSEKAFQRTEHYVKVTDKTFGGFIVGKLVDSLIMGVLCFILMNIFRMPYAPLISMIIGVTNVIPFFGPFIGAIPSAFIILIADMRMTIWFILLVFILQQIDGNLIGPKILGDFVGLNPLWIIISITVMGGLFGVFGMFLGVPTFAVIYAIVKELTEKQLETKGLSTETNDYYNDGQYIAVTAKKPHDPEKSLITTIKAKFRKKS
ncbi:MAG: AI-2E family transporter [Clostridia bacterium]|nr:AI-2E family transporter [Clostridia bacterium]